jgi:DNA invertase Pin-like site-specific DNA recombinase
MRVALYTRVSTDQQTTENQFMELRDVAEKRGWTIVDEFEDCGISGAKGRDKRPALDAMLTKAGAGHFDMVAAWSIDRLGRSLIDLITMLQLLRQYKVGLYLHQQALDTNTPSGQAMFGMLGVFAEFERATIQERVKAGMKRAKAQGKKLGKPAVLTDDEHKELRVRRRMGIEVKELMNDYGISRATVYRILQYDGDED